MEPGYFWPVIFFLAIGTFAIRASIISISHRVTISPRQREIFSFIPAAIFPAIVTPMVVFHHGQVAWLDGNERAVVLLLATILCFFTRNMLVIVGFGLIVLYVLKLI